MVAHRRVDKFILKLKEENLKNRIKDVIAKLKDYPLVLREMNLEKIRGLEKTSRIRISRYRVIEKEYTRN